MDNLDGGEDKIAEGGDSSSESASFFSDKSNFLGISILASAIIVSGTLIFVFGPGFNGGSQGLLDSDTPPTAGERVPSVDISVGDAPLLGDPNAPVLIVEYSDFQCPYCARFFEQTLPMIKKEYVDTGMVKFAYKDFPLTSIHPEAEKAAETARCVGDQLGDDGYWEMHDILFERQQLLSVSSYKQWARSLGVNGEEFDDCLDAGKYTEAVMSDLEEGASLGVTGTPTFFINGTKVVGAVPYEQIKAVIEAELAE